MHESLPKGELDALLGSVPPYTASESPRILPDFGEGEEHPCHIIIVAGQECPSATGLLPMAFGAGNSLTVREKDKDKKVGRRKRSDDQYKRLENSPDSTLLLDLPASPTMSHFPSTGNLPTSSTILHHRERETGGWTQILEDWFVRGIRRSGSMEEENQNGEVPQPLSQPTERTENVSADTVAQSASPQLNRSPSDSVPHKHNHPLHLLTSTAVHTSHPTSNQHTGSYVLAVKERMMGIYLAAYVHRDVEHLLQGKDADAVTAGLIGGRVGNKGGVGVSLKIAGITFLFVNAHLAAHTGRVDLRMANLSKIKTELSLDAFLGSDDPRQMAEDITDRFDYSFFFGDLNFRLDISRLHADWLISRKEFAQALEFDQLRGLMKDGQFPGFSEGPINFPPTFKYDVQHRHRSHRMSVRKAIQKTREQLRKLDVYDEVSEQEDNAVNDSQDGVEVAEDHLSFVSSVIGSSLYSGSGKYETDPDSESVAADANAEDSPALLNAVANSKSPSSRPAAAIHNIMHSQAARKAKSKWLALVARARGASVHSSRSNQPCQGSGHTQPPKSPKFSKSTPSLSRRGPRTRRLTSKSSPPCSPPGRCMNSHLDHVSSEPTPCMSSAGLPSIEVAGPTDTSPVTMPKFESSPSSVQPQPGGTSQSGSEKEKAVGAKDEVAPGVYDTSSKQRVPSWCDRILYKSTVVPDPEEESPDQQRTAPKGFRVGRKIIDTIFTRTSRCRKDSSASTAPSYESSTHTPQRSQSTPTNLESVHLSSGISQSPISIGDNVPYFAMPSPQFVTTPVPRSVSLGAVEAYKLSSPSSQDAPNAKQKRSFSSSSLPFLKKSRSKPSINLPQANLPRSTSPLPIVSQVPSASIPSKCTPPPRPVPGRRWFLQLPSSILNPSPLVPGLSTSIAPMRRRRKGEVTCLSYRTLDDCEMARLRGKSDHRPIIGVYSICIE
ncbi:uncharacterized protein EI90DRAFT_3038677 [Cantharellus anzutake]|uniref:uncharacterized protein n=1 Tax=Cantharellus anzutake TaxID=1750568 RepID=UPI0019054E65|nr:uncharacterized protein EI90DRAFT_3038677 [Cantharellus anzutake]KAF8339974.1 hypothetical protein EI90DRAFT_3038677 [Cantharellus anzutake]